MAFARYERTLVDDAGNVILNASVTVRREAPGFPLAIPLYEDFDGASGQSNPISVTDGTLAFHVVGGFYRIEIVASGYSKTLRYVAIGTAQGADVDAYATAGFTWAPESTTTAPPTTGCIRFNNADVTAATHVYISHDTLGGSDAETWLTGMQAGEELLISTGVGIEIAWTIANRSNQTGYVDFTVSGYVGPAGPLALGDSGFVTVAKSGKTGRAPGYSYKFDDATSGDPGSGHFGLNNATVASATAIRFSETDAESNAISALLASWDDSTTTTARGTILLRKVGVPTTFAIFTITSAITDSGGYDSFTVAHVASAGTFSDEDSFTVEFSRTGNLGATGATGQSAGVNYAYSTTTTDSDPGAGIFRLNNAAPASATAAYIDNVDAGGVSMTTWLDSFDDSTSTSKGLLILKGVTTPAAEAIYRVTGSVVDGTGYRKLTLTHMSSGGTFTNTDLFSLIFVPTGDKGDTGATGATGLTGATGSAGTNGTNGSDGVNAGLKFTFSTTTADADPGNGNLRLNNATPASATAAYIDNVDADGATVTSWLDTLDDSTNTAKGTLIVRSIAAPATFAQYAVSGSVVDGTGYRKLTLSYLAGNGSFSNGNAIAISFDRTGDKGADGAGTGDMIAANNLSDVANPATARDNLGAASKGFAIAMAIVF